MTGLSIALELCKKNFKVVVLEKNRTVGGVATSIRANGYTFDIGPHYVTLPKESSITDEIYELVGKENIVKLSPNIRRSRKAYFRNRLWNEFPSASQLVKSLKFSAKLYFLFEFVATRILSNLGRYDENNSEDYLISNYGKFLFKNWFVPYYQNLYYTFDVPRKGIEEKFPPLNFKRMLKLFKKIEEKKNENNSEYFHCYFRNGMISLIDGIGKKITELGGDIITDADIKEINHASPKKISYASNNQTNSLSVDWIIYTLPLNIAKRWFDSKDQEPSAIKSSLSSIMVFLFINKKQVFDNWIVDVFDKKINSWRIAQQSYLSDSIAPKDKSLLSVEIRARPDEEIWKTDERELYEIVSTELEKMNILKSNIIDGYKIIKLQNVYPLDNEDNSEKEIQEYINSFENEIGVGTEIDSKIANIDNKKSDGIPRIGGVYRAMNNANYFVKSLEKSKLFIN